MVDESPCVAPQAKKGPRIRQGSPQEEAALAAHLVGLAPSPGALQDAGALAEALVALGQERAAAALQAALSRLVSHQKVCRRRRLFPQPLGSLRRQPCRTINLHFM